MLTFVGGATAEYVLVLMGYLASVAGLYYDTKYVRTVSRWKPATAGYIVGTILLMIVVVPIYLYRRHKEL